eukprot:14491724-Ditylum_brightwellii.AAC.1
MDDGAICGGGGCQADYCIETCIAEEELDVLDEEQTWLDVTTTNTVFTWAQEKEESNPDEVKDYI